MENKVIFKKIHVEELLNCMILLQKMNVEYINILAEKMNETEHSLHIVGYVEDLEFNNNIPSEGISNLKNLLDGSC